MTRHFRSRVKEILDHALDLDVDDRARYVETASNGDTELQRTVLALLRDYQSAEREGFLEEPRPAAGRIGQRVGAYRITALIGRGGRGDVYEAVRDDAEFTQHVAIKFLRESALDEDALRRFRIERQLLAGIRHSNVAKLIDGGTSQDGVPYLVMEYVDGQHIDTYCDQKRLRVEDRLALFLDVCGAVQSAHNKLVVHRDLKPSNILVDREGHSKLLDFGIAKLLDTELVDWTVESTALDRRLLTPEYASPEQFRGEPVTVASDIYSLGVVLYELLSGHRPYSFDGLAPGEIDEVLCQRDPPRPSQLVLQPRTLAGDLDNIVLMAMRKEPERRYQTVNELAADVHRYLSGLPVRAREPTASYRIGKFIRRNSSAVATGVAALALIGLFVFWNYRARRIAEAESAKARAVSQFLEDTLATADPSSGTGRATPVFDVLQNAEAELSDAFPENPAVEASVRNTIGAAYLTLGEYDRAEANLARALSLRESIYPETHLDVLESTYQMGSLRYQTGDYDEARLLLEHAIRGLRAAGKPARTLLSRALTQYGVLLIDLTRAREAEAALREALELVPVDARPTERASLHTFLAITLELAGELEGAERHHWDAETIFARHGIHRHFRVAQNKAFLADLLIQRSELDEAERLVKEALEIDREILGEGAPAVARELRFLGDVASKRGRHADAIDHYQSSVEIFSKVLGPQHAGTARVRVQLGRAMLELDRLDDAERELVHAYQALRESLGREHPRTDRVREALAELYERLDDPERAARFQPSGS